MNRSLAALLIAAFVLPATGQIKREERASKLDSDPEVVYLDRTVKKPIELNIIREAPVYSDKEGRRQVGFIRANQTVKLEAMTDRAYRVRGQGTRNAIVGWVGPFAFESKDPDFVENLKKLYDRQMEVGLLIAARQVAIGMTLDEVSQSLGKPVKTSSRQTAQGHSGKWEYAKYEEVKHYVTRIHPVTKVAYRQLSHVTREEKEKTVVEFENDLVTAIEESENQNGGNVRIIVPPLVYRW